MLDLEKAGVRFAVHATQRTALLVRRVQQELAMPALSKEDQSPVTVADFTAQALFAALLEQAFPGDVLVGEESAEALRKPDGQEMLELVTRYVRQEISGTTPDQVCDWIDCGQAQPGERFWVLDPVDGTKGFLRGGQYAVALALIENEQVQLGVLGCPKLEGGWKESQNGTGSLVIAQKGSGTWTSSLEEHSLQPGKFQRACVSSQDDPQQARLLRSYEASHTNAAVIDSLVKQLDITAPASRLDSQAKYSILANGKSEIIIRIPPSGQADYREKIWDIAAGALVVEEAGGQASDLDGQKLDFGAGRRLEHNRGILVTNGTLHSKFIRALSKLRV